MSQCKNHDRIPSDPSIIPIDDRPINNNCGNCIHWRPHEERCDINAGLNKYGYRGSFYGKGV